MDNIISYKKELYSITEIANLSGVNSHTLRYWEKKGLLSPIRLKNAQRRYTKEHIESILRLKKMVVEDKFTTTAIRKKMRGKNNSADNMQSINIQKANVFLKDITRDLKDILKFFN